MSKRFRPLWKSDCVCTAPAFGEMVNWHHSVEGDRALPDESWMKCEGFHARYVITHSKGIGYWKSSLSASFQTSLK